MRWRVIVKKHPDKDAVKAADGRHERINNKLTFIVNARWLGVSYIYCWQAFTRSDGQSVPKPACESGGAAKVYDLPSSINTTGGKVNFTALDAGANWTVQIKDGLGVALTGDVIAQTFCEY